MITPAGNDVVVMSSAGAVIVILSAAVAVFAVGVSESVTITVKLVVPTNGPVGFPVMAPVEPFSERPAGRLPTLMDQVYGVIPPVAARVWLYDVPITPAARLVVVTETGGFTAMLRFAVAVFAVGVSESVTVTVKFDVPAVVGVPLIAPVLELSISPVGNDPVVTAQV